MEPKLERIDSRTKSAGKRPRAFFGRQLVGEDERGHYIFFCSTLRGGEYLQTAKGPGFMNGQRRETEKRPSLIPGRG